jgi:hypothetical protein
MERCYLLTKPAWREHDEFDSWAVRALLQGDRTAADECCRRYLGEGAPISPFDRARIAKMRELLV